MGLEGSRLGNYTLKKQLGRGGMGVVFLGVQDELDRPVAVKILPDNSAARSDDLVRRFRKEVNVCARLSHPNIVKVYDAGFENGMYYYAMELLEATSLEDKLKQCGRMPIAEALRIARDICEAFRYYMPQGIVHRDLKPANIMMDGTGKAIVTDFGLVKDLLGTSITHTGVAVGTPYYMSPEMIYAKGVGPPADIYQFGVILYRMLTGALPFTGKTATEVFKAILNTEPERPSKVNAEIYPALENLILNCLARNLDYRYADAETLSKDLAAATRKGKVPLLAQPVSGVVSSATAETPPGGGAQLTGPLSGVRPAGQLTGPLSGVRPGGQNTGPMAGVGGPQPNTGPMAGAGSGVQVTGRLSGTRGGALPSGRMQVALPGTQPTDQLSAQQVPAAGSGTMVWASVLLLLAAAGGAAYALRPKPIVEMTASEMLLLPTAHGVRATWSSQLPYEGRIEWGEEGVWRRTEAAEPAATMTHRGIVEGLAPDHAYQLRVVYPGGKKSLDYAFRTPSSDLSGAGLVQAGSKWRLRFRTERPLKATLVVDGSPVSDAAPVADHDLEMGSSGFVREKLELTLADAAGEVTRLSGEKLTRELLVGAASELAKSLPGFDPGKFLLEKMNPLFPNYVCTRSKILLDADGLDEVLGPDGQIHSVKTTHYTPFKPGDPDGAAIAEKVRAWFAAEPQAPQLSLLLRLGQGALDTGFLPLPAVLTLHEALERVREIDQLSGVLRLGVRLGADDAASTNYKLRYEPSLPPSDAVKDQPMPGNRIFAAPWAEFQQYSIFSPVANWERHGPFKWTADVQNAAKLTRAELVLKDVYLLFEHRFSVTVNGQMKLRFAIDPAVYNEGKNKLFPTLAQSFDPRVLRDGPNELLVEMEVLPGARRLAVKNGYLSGVRLAVE